VTSKIKDSRTLMSYIDSTLNINPGDEATLSDAVR